MSKWDYKPQRKEKTFQPQPIEGYIDGIPTDGVLIRKPFSSAGVIDGGVIQIDQVTPKVEGQLIYFDLKVKVTSIGGRSQETPFLIKQGANVLKPGTQPVEIKVGDRMEVSLVPKLPGSEAKGIWITFNFKLQSGSVSLAEIDSSDRGSNAGTDVSNKGK